MQEGRGIVRETETDQSSNGTARGDGGDGARADVARDAAAGGEGGEDVGGGVLSLVEVRLSASCGGTIVCRAYHVVTVTDY